MIKREADPIKNGSCFPSNQGSTETQNLSCNIAGTSESSLFRNIRDWVVPVIIVVVVVFVVVGWGKARTSLILIPIQKVYNLMVLSELS